MAHFLQGKEEGVGSLLLAEKPIPFQMPEYTEKLFMTGFLYALICIRSCQRQALCMGELHERLLSGRFFEEVNNERTGDK